MQAWAITANVTDEQANELGALVNEVEQAFQAAVNFKVDGEPQFIEWMNGLLAGIAELNNIIICPEEYPNPRLTLKMATVQLTAILLRFQLAQSFSLPQPELEKSPDTISEPSSSTMVEETTS